MNNFGKWWLIEKEFCWGEIKKLWEYVFVLRKKIPLNMRREIFSQRMKAFNCNAIKNPILDTSRVKILQEDLEVEVYLFCFASKISPSWYNHLIFSPVPANFCASYYYGFKSTTVWECHPPTPTKKTKKTAT